MSGPFQRRPRNNTHPIMYASRPVNTTPYQTIRPSSSVSPFELFLKRASNTTPLATTHRPANANTSTPHLLDYFHDHIPLSSLLTLRLVSRLTKYYLDHTSPSPLSHLHLTLPANPTPSLPALKPLLRHCTHLKLIILPPPSPPNTDNDPSSSSSLLTTVFTLLPQLTTLHISLSPGLTPHPHPDQHHHQQTHTLLLSLRHALERCAYALENLHTLRLHPITVRGLLALRSGAFSCFEQADWMRGKFWMGVRRLEVGMVGFLPSCDGVGLRVGGGVDGAESGDGGGGKERVGGAWAECWDVREERAKRKRDAVRMGVKILHDFLHGLAPGLEGVEFEWLDRTGSDPSRDTHSGTLRTPSSSSSGGSGSSAALPSSSAFPTPSSASTAPLSSSAASTAPCSLPSSPSSPSRSAHPNPLLLDLEVPRLFPPSRFAASAGDGSTAAAGPPGGPITKWFTAPPILWPRLREVRLGGVGMAGEDVRRLKGRAKGLESVWVGVGYWEGGEVGEGVGGKGHGGVKWWNREWAREDGDVEGGVGRGVRLRRGFGVEGGGGGGRGIGEEGGWVRIDVRGVEGVPVEVDRMKIGGRSRGGSSGFDGAGGGGERKGGSSRSTTRHLFEGAKEERKAGKEAEGKVRKEGGSGAEKEVEVSQEDATRQDSELELEDCNIGHGVESMVLTFILDTGPGA